MRVVVVVVEEAAEVVEEAVEVDKVHGDEPPYIVETQLPDVKKEMQGL